MLGQEQQQQQQLKNEFTKPRRAAVPVKYWGIDSFGMTGLIYAKKKKKKQAYSSDILSQIKKIKYAACLAAAAFGVFSC